MSNRSHNLKLTAPAPAACGLGVGFVFGIEHSVMCPPASTGVAKT